MSNFHIRKVAVLGAGVMGAQIAAHLSNANVETLLFELPPKEGDPNANVNKALDGDMMAAREVGDRLDGKPAQALQHTGGDGGPVVVTWLPPQ